MTVPSLRAERVSSNGIYVHIYMFSHYTCIHISAHWFVCVVLPGSISVAVNDCANFAGQTRVAVCCSVVQCVAVFCSVLQCDEADVFLWTAYTYIYISPYTPISLPWFPCVTSQCQVRGANVFHPTAYTWIYMSSHYTYIHTSVHWFVSVALPGSISVAVNDCTKFAGQTCFLQRLGNFSGLGVGCLNGTTPSRDCLLLQCIAVYCIVLQGVAQVWGIWTVEPLVNTRKSQLYTYFSVMNWVAGWFLRIYTSCKEAHSQNIYTYTYSFSHVNYTWMNHSI